MAQSWRPGPKFDDLTVQRSTPNRQLSGTTKPEFSPDRNGEPIHRSNAFLDDGSGNRVYLWVDDMGASFNISGSTAQSYNQRAFYPHNLGQLMLTVHGQTPNESEYGRVAEFVRHSHKKAVTNGQFFRLVIAEGGHNPDVANPPTTTRDQQVHGVKGRHEAVDVDGYVLSIDRKHERFVNAPEWEFQFVILRSKGFLGLKDDVIQQKNLITILQLVNQTGEYAEFDWEKPIDIYGPTDKLNAAFPPDSD